ncbi:MAG: hypothetical protein K0R78_397 [Pelosinus sp.]|jgi:hypothetical protein|nr:hypothetical protein [Pelosinus sp.]
MNRYNLILIDDGNKSGNEGISEIDLFRWLPLFEFDNFNKKQLHNETNMW